MNLTQNRCANLNSDTVLKSTKRSVLAFIIKYFFLFTNNIKETLEVYRVTEHLLS